MPAPTSTRVCGYCERPFAVVGPVAYRMTAAGDRFQWTMDGDEVATAIERDGNWDVFDLRGSRPALTLVPVNVDGTTRVALVDHRSRLVATFAPAERGGHGLGVVRDGYDRILLLARADGPTGLHVIDNLGNVLALASRSERSGVDILLLSDTANSLIVLGITLLLELVRAGSLRRAA